MIIMHVAAASLVFAFAGAVVAVATGPELIGIASSYGPGFDGHPTAMGEIFERDDLTAASRSLPLPCVIRVTNLGNGRTLVLRVNDRGPYVTGRILDVSEHAADLLDFHRQGLARVRIDILFPEDSAGVPDGAPDASQTSQAPE